MTSSERLEWLRNRQTGIGGSDVAAILGLSKYRTPLDVYLSKTEEVVEDAPSQAAYWGTQLEDIVAKEFQKRTGMKVQRVNQQLHHPAENWMMANIDRAVVNPDIAGNVRVLPGEKQKELGRMLTTDTILECKTASSFIASQWGESQETEIVADKIVTEHKIPIYYETQVQWYLGITGASRCFVAVLLGGQDFRIYCVNRDDDVIDALQQACSNFWFKHVLPKIHPAPCTQKEVEKMFAHDSGDMVEADNLIAANIGDLRNIDEQIKNLNAEKERLKDRICSALGEKSGFTIAGEKACTYKSQKQTRFDSTRFKKEQPETYAAFTKTTESRVFRLSV